MSHRSLERSLSVFTMVLPLVAASCGNEIIDDDQTVTTSSALTTPDRTFSDASGDITVLVRTCDWPAAFTTGHRCAYCALDQGWVMTGGGAEIRLQTSTSTNARLRGSLPDPAPIFGADGLIQVVSDDLTDRNCSGNVPQTNSPSTPFMSWQARSDGTSSHKLRAYVVGLKIAGVDPEALYDAVSYHDVVGPVSGTDAEIVRGILIGGGADMLADNSAGPPLGYLTETRPDVNTGAWHAAGYDATGHVQIKAYSISTDLAAIGIPGWSGGLYAGLRSVTSGAAAGTRTASGTTRYPFVVSSIGAQGVTNGTSSRFLTGLVPFASSTDGFTVTTKDQGTSVIGPTTGYSLGILGGRWGTWLENTVLFWTGGNLFRPSGTNPRLQRSSTAAPDTAATRWAFEAFGTGTYRLRNGNPGTGTECAYRESSTSTNVRVTTCGTGSQFLWQFVNDPGNIFQVRNVASGTCLDNNNASTGANSNVVLKPCVSGWSDTQELMLDKWNWPIP